jgi:hypothetical protein
VRIKRAQGDRGECASVSFEVLAKTASASPSSSNAALRCPPRPSIEVDAAVQANGLSPLSRLRLF